TLMIWWMLADAKVNKQLTSLCSVLFSLSEHKILPAESGQKVTLTCRAPNNSKRVTWSRADLRDKYVLLYQDGHLNPDNQHPSFKSRLTLQDRQMKDGDVSLILKDANTADSGTYMCRVFMEETRSWKLLINNYLIVVPPGEATSCLLMFVVVWMSWWVLKLWRLVILILIMFVHMKVTHICVALTSVIQSQYAATKLFVTPQIVDSVHLDVVSGRNILSLIQVSRMSDEISGNQHPDEQNQLLGT
uniref:Ig-like domain-containing protein n=1 Tax=Haplochromis burtoni TaxID=8153 RepID=A0A3Q2VX20_HAPBU